MPDVLIRNLRVRIVRKGSLFWGEDPRRLARRALVALPELLAEQLDGLGDGARESGGPVRLVFRGTVASLLESLSVPGGTEELRATVRKALEEVFGPASLPATSGEPRSEPPAPPRAPGAAPLGELLHFHLRGELGELLERFPLELLEAYHRALLEKPPPGGMTPPALSAEARLEAERFIEALAVGLGPAGDRRLRLRQRLLAVVNLAASTGVPPFEGEVRAAVDRYLPLAGGSEHASGTGDAQKGTSEVPRRKEGRATPSSGPRSEKASSGTEPHGQEARTSAGGAAVDGSARGATPEGEPPGEALSRDAMEQPSPAGSVLASERDPRSRGTTPASESPGAAPRHAAVREPRSSQMEGEAARAPRTETPHGGATPRQSTTGRPLASEEQPAPLLPLLVASVLYRAGIVTRVERQLAQAGATEELPLWVAALTFKLGPRPIRGWMYAPEVWAQAALLSGNPLFSGEGLARLADAPSVAWPELTQALVPILAPPDAPLVAVLSGDAIALMTEAPMAPVWSGPAELPALLQAAAGRRVSRHHPLAPQLLPEATDCRAELADGLRETLQLLTERSACPLARLPHFDRHLGVVAGWALARIGATLWPEETPPAVLVMERFASLQVQVRRDEEGLAVRVPLGRRRTDLYGAGLLADIDRAPWLFGGSLRFRGG